MAVILPRLAGCCAVEKPKEVTLQWPPFGR